MLCAVVANNIADHRPSGARGGAGSDILSQCALCSTSVVCVEGGIVAFSSVG